MKITKRICIVVMVCLNIILQCSGAFAAKFVEVYRGDRYLIFIDVSSLKDEGDYVTAWGKTIYRGRYLEEIKKKYGKTAAYSMELWAYKTTAKESQLLSLCVYDNDRLVLDSHNWAFSPYGFKPLPPETIGENIWEFVMAWTNH